MLCIKRSSYVHIPTIGTDYVAVYDDRGNFVKYIEINTIVELQPFLPEGLNRDHVYNSDPELKGSRVVELCKTEPDQHSVTLLRFLLEGQDTVPDIVLLNCNDHNVSYSVSLNELLKHGVTPVITPVMMEMIEILIEHSPDLVFRLDVSSQCALYTLVYKCEFTTDTQRVLKLMCETLYNIVVNNLCGTSIAQNNYRKDNCHSRVKTTVPETIIDILTNASTLLLLRCSETGNITDVSVCMLKYILKTSRRIHDYSLCNSNKIKSMKYNFNLNGKYFDSTTTVLHLLLSSVTVTDTRVTDTRVTDTRVTDMYELVLKYGFYNNDDRDRFINTVTDDNGITCGQYIDRLTV